MNGLMISADSHVIEPSELWIKQLPDSFKERAPKYPARTSHEKQQGGRNPSTRVSEMAVDGVIGEVLYPSLAMDQFSISDPLLQEACFRVYNDWLIDYCAHAPDHLFGVAVISGYRIDEAVKELYRCKKEGMRGAMIWQAPPEEFSFASDHYDKFWNAAQELELPISLHILSGVSFYHGDRPPRHAVPALKRAVTMKLHYAILALSDIIASGVLERFPRLKVVLVENEVSWLPFIITQWDKYCGRSNYESTMTMLPSEYFRRQIYATFFNDPPTRWMFNEWGADNCMWSNDFPHTNSTWPNSREIIARDLGNYSQAIQNKLVRDNVVRLYNIKEITEQLAA